MFLIDLIIFDLDTSWQQLCGFFLVVTFSLIQVIKVFCCDDTKAMEAQKQRNSVDIALAEVSVISATDDDNFKSVK